MHTFVIDGPGHDLRVLRFEGHEALSQLFEMDVVLACPANDLAFDDVVGKRALLTIHAGDEPRHVHGIVASLEQGKEGKKLTSYRATLVPAVWRLQHRRDSRIFQEMTVPRIVEVVLTTAGIPPQGFRFALGGGHSPREYCVQYRESDWAFLCRLMEEEGIAYHFEHSSTGHVLVMADGPSAYLPIPGASALPFRPPTGALAEGEHVSDFRYAERISPGKVTLRDHDFQRPELRLESERRGPVDDDLEIYDHTGDHAAPGRSALERIREIAGMRLEELQVARKRGEGESDCARLLPGATFSLTEHPRDDFNRPLLITRVEHHGREPHLEQAEGAAEPGPGAAYGNRFQVIPAGQPFRPPRVTPRPVIRGIQTAIVTGPAGDEIYTDEHGRIKVQFHWDRHGTMDDRSSCWIRVSQIWAGSAWGAVFLPRVGHEVVVDFIEGDPDRPLVVGSVYHGTNVPPYALPGEKTRSTIKSRSSMGGGGSNELRFEDRKGEEEVYLHAEKDWNILVEHDRSQEIGHDDGLHVGHDRRKTILHDQSESIGGHKTTQVALTHTEGIGLDESLSVGANRTVSVVMDHTESVGGDQSIEVAGAQSVGVGKSMSLSVAEGKTETVGESSDETVGAGKTVRVEGTFAITVKKDMSITAGENATEDVAEKKTLVVGEELSIQVGDATITVKKNGDITLEGKQLLVKGTGPIQIEGKKLQVKSEGDVLVEAGGNVSVKGSNIGMN